MRLVTHGIVNLLQLSFAGTGSHHPIADVGLGQDTPAVAAGVPGAPAAAHAAVLSAVRARTLRARSPRYFGARTAGAEPEDPLGDAEGYQVSDWCGRVFFPTQFEFL
jgi:hypothetical protein